MKKHYYILAALCFTLLVEAQMPLQWQKCLGGTAGDYAQSIQQTTDGGYIVSGFVASTGNDVTGNHGLDDYWVVKLDNLGAIQWQKCLGGTGSDQSYAVHQTADGGYILAGFATSNNGDVSGNHGSDDYWVVKLSSSGNLQWQKAFGGTSADDAFAIQQTADGGYIVLGDTQSNDGDVSGNHGSYDVWILKLDASGNIQWQKCLGGTGDDTAASVQQTNDGGYIIGGSTKSSNGDASGNHGDFDFWIVKLNSAGTLKWQKCLGGTGQDIGYAVQQNADSSYVIAGFTKSNNGDVSGFHGSTSLPDYWVVKLDTAGILQWQKCLGGTNDDKAYSMRQTSDGGFVLAGYTRSNDGDVSGNHANGVHDYWIVKLSPAGSLQWQQCLGGSGTDWARCIRQTADGGYVAAGFTTSNNTGNVSGFYGNNDYWVVKLGPVITGAPSFQADQPIVFPNPTSGSFSVVIGSERAGAVLKLRNGLGELVFETELKGDHNEIDLPAKAPGVYYLTVTDESGQKGSKLIIE